LLYSGAPANLSPPFNPIDSRKDADKLAPTARQPDQAE
jgi:hypothetical protein